MTRQPALEHRIAVAWPMPRLAPVRSSVRRGALDEDDINGSLVLRVMPGHVPGIHVFGPIRSSAMTVSVSGIEPDFAPGLRRRIAAEFDAVVQAERTVVPEFEAGRRNAPAAPPGRAPPFANHIA